MPSPSLKPIAAELRDKGVATINSLHLEVKPIKGRPPVVRSTTTSGPYKQAEELRYYPFGDSHQFTTQKPFMLVFPYLPRFNMFLTEDSSGLNEKFFRSLARRAFIQLSNDPRDCSECDSAVASAVTVGYASTTRLGSRPCRRSGFRPLAADRHGHGSAAAWGASESHASSPVD
jgi:hypothetical protein